MPASERASPAICSSASAGGFDEPRRHLQPPDSKGFRRDSNGGVRSPRDVTGCFHGDRIGARLGVQIDADEGAPHACGGIERKREIPAEHGACRPVGFGRTPRRSARTTSPG